MRPGSVGCDGLVLHRPGVAEWAVVLRVVLVDGVLRRGGIGNRFLDSVPVLGVDPAFVDDGGYGPDPRVALRTGLGCEACPGVEVGGREVVVEDLAPASRSEGEHGVAVVCVEGWPPVD